MVTPQNIQDWIQAGLACEHIQVAGDGQHFEAVIVSPAFAGKLPVARHQLVYGVLGERMLGGGDKGAAGCLVLADSAKDVKKAVDIAYPKSRPDFADKYAVHTCRVVDGIKLFENVL